VDYLPASFWYPLVVQSTPPYRIVQLANGTRSIHSAAYDETFHPVIGPAAEAEALYVRQLRLPERVQEHQGEFVIWDVGLGAAANVLTLLRATRHLVCSLRILSFDQTLEPLRFALAHAGELGYFDGYAQLTGLRLKHPEQVVTWADGLQSLSWELRVADFPELVASHVAEGFAKPHAILFDAFSPATNPAMWTLPLFTRLFQLLDPGSPCALPTYSRSTMLRTTLLLAGFFVGKGHATGEKEETTIAANSPDLIAEPLDRRWLRRARNSTSAEPLHTPIYRQVSISPESWDRLRDHPQFQ
jgi:tRNA U34 5-methylaminomethyl-2-thiouridine-forming methyltransferase MnmC